MPWRYLIKQLLLPPGCFVLLLLLAWWLRRPAPRLAGACVLLAALGLWALSAPLAVEGLGRLIESEPPLAEAQWPTLAQRAEVIVVLGAGRQRGDPGWGNVDQPGLFALDRVRYAARLARASGLPLLTTGGLHYGEPPSEAQIMAESLERDYGVPVRWRETRSRTTWENAVFSAEMLREAGIHRVVLVTQAWHMPRARWCFEQQGLDVVTAPFGYLGVPHARPWGGVLPEMSALWQGSLLLNEGVGRLLYPLAYGR